jgi:glycosyltransferase involved in cell wall biosynthesis
MPFNSQGPKVSVLMITYNHEPFIAQAIESALMQETTFNFEIVIGEDCSTDETRKIVRDFQRKYPEKIRLLLPERNLGMHCNYFQTLRACSGQYIAVLDGDDFWTSPHKLQRQADFLDSHPDYTVCFHNVTVFREGAEESGWLHCPPDQKQTCTVEDLLKGNFIPTCSVMRRNGLITELPEWTYGLKMLDWPIHILNAQHGYIGYIDETMAAHRMHSDGLYSGLSPIEQQLNYLKMYEALLGPLGSEYEKSIRVSIFRSWYALAVAYSQENDAANADKYRHLCLGARPIGNHLVRKLKLVLRFRTPRLFKLGYYIKRVSQIARSKATVKRRKALIGETVKA